MHTAKQIRLLLVDDDSDLSTTVKKGLALQCDYDVDLVSSVDDALEKMTQKDYDLIVCDIRMSLTDGFEFLNELRTSGNQIPFIVFSVADDKETALTAFSLGANGFVGKYGNPKVVFSILKRCIDEAVKNFPKKLQTELLEVIQPVFTDN
ncbi:MAG: response regulator [Candidatus Bathyarchaeota archaeon]|nr:response regulator [Candidatus Bathyarchaeum sp.]